MEGFNTIKGFSTIEEVLDELRQGKIVLVTDDENRENEGDFICAAQHATTENVNFMAVHGKGLICMPMSPELCTRLKLPQMVSHNSDNHETAFTVSIFCIFPMIFPKIEVPPKNTNTIPANTPKIAIKSEYELFIFSLHLPIL